MSAGGGSTARERVDEAGQLRRVLDVAAEQDNAGGRKGSEKRRLLGRQGEAGDADDGGGGRIDCCHRFAASMSRPFPSLTTAGDVDSELKRGATMSQTRKRHPSRGSRPVAFARG